MFRPRALGFACTCLLIATSLGAAPSEPRPLDPLAELRAENRRLSDENRNLRTQLAVLQAQNRDLQLRLAQPQGRALPMPAPNAPQRPNVQPDDEREFQMPGTQRGPQAPREDWVPREFNGKTVYVVPCDTGNPSPASGRATMIDGALAAPTANTAARGPSETNR